MISVTSPQLSKIAIFFASMMLCACNGIMDNIYDDVPPDTDFGEGFNLNHDNGRLLLYLNATSYQHWHYLSLADLTVESYEVPSALTGDWDGLSGWTYNYVKGDECTPLRTMPTDAQPQPLAWDLAIHHYDVRTNGGSAIETQYTSLDQLPPNNGQYDGSPWVADAYDTATVMVDINDMLAYRIGYQNIQVNQVLSQWVKMDISNPPPTFSSTGKVYILKLANGELAAMHLLSYMSPKGTKGYLTIDILYPY